MRVMRGKTFEGKRGVWEKIEVELDSSDLLPDEQAAAPQVQSLLLQVRADKNLILFLMRQGQMTKEEGHKHLEELQEYKNSLLKVKSPPTLRKR